MTAKKIMFENTSPAYKYWMKILTKRNEGVYDHNENIKNASRLLAHTLGGADGPQVEMHAPLSIVIAPMQSGKTDIQTLLARSSADIFSKKLNRKNLKIGVIALTAKSQTDIKKQTGNRYKEVGFKEYLLPPAVYQEVPRSRNIRFQMLGDNIIAAHVMLSSNAYKNKDIAESEEAKGQLVAVQAAFKAEEVDATLIIVDEFHIGTKDKQQFSDFLKEALNIKFEHNSIPTNVMIIGFSATVFRGYTYPTYEYEIPVLYAKPGANYFGIDDIIKSGRMIDVRSIDSAEQMINLIERYVKTKKPGHHIFRVRSERGLWNREIALIQEIAKHFGWDSPTVYQAQQYNSDYPTEPLSHLPDRIAQKLNKNTCLIMKAGIGAGITLENIENVKMWWDLRFSNEESIAQTIGRLAGYNPDRRTAKFPVFADMEKIEDFQRPMRKLADDSDPELPAYIDAPETLKPKKEKLKTLRAPKGILTEWKYGTFAEYSDFMKRVYPAEFRNITRAHQNKTRDWALKIINGDVPPTGNNFILCIPPHWITASERARVHPTYPDSYKKLMEKFPVVKKYNEKSVLPVAERRDQMYGFWGINLEYFEEDRRIIPAIHLAAQKEVRQRTPRITRITTKRKEKINLTIQNLEKKLEKLRQAVA